MRNVEWVTNNLEGLIWYRVVQPSPPGRVLGIIMFYTLRGAKRASAWRAFRGGEPGRMCFTLKEAVDWVEVEPA